MPNQNEIRRAITQTIIDTLKNGQLPPWRKPWRNDKNSGLAANVVSKRPYSGINPLLLEIASRQYSLVSRYWATFNQWKELGGKVKPRPKDVAPGKWGTQIVFYKPVSKLEKDDEGNETEKRFSVLRYYTVFNIDQVEGEHLDHIRVGNDTEATPLEERFDGAEAVIDATGADIRFGGNRAFYNRSGDFIQCPNRSQFELPEYYETLFHELVHWSESRRDWKGSYAMGELIAEIGACYLATEIGIPNSSNLDNHAAYLKSWLAEMQNDPRFIFEASTQASKAADYIVSFSQSPEAALAS